MSTNLNKMRVRDLEVDIVKKNINNTHLGVYPPNGRIRVAAPLQTKDETIRLLVISKMSWIEKQQAKFKKQER